MTIEAQYAKALYELVQKDPPQASKYLENLKMTLNAKGHQKLISGIFAEYQRIEEQKKRLGTYAQTSPAEDRTRILLELYRKLVTSQ